MLALQGYYDGNMDESDSKDEKKSARGILAQYADPSLQEKEQYAWEKAVTEKHGSA